MTNPSAARDIDTSRPHSARMYDYYLGGKDNFPADREAAAKVIAAAPSVPQMARENRAFMVRAVRHLAAHAGIRQFLDIGTGIPTSPNLHEVAQAVLPDARVVYADNDPLVLAHARALLTGNPAGRTAYLDADLRDVDAILGSSEVRGTLDLTQPVALSVFAILHFVPDSDDPYGVIRRLLDALAPGSYLALSHGTADFGSTGSAEGVASYRARGITLQLRDAAELARFFDGLDLVDPGVQALNRWRPESDSALTEDPINMYGAVGRLR